ncbi:lysophospholipid acyltransferase family protein [Planctomicrobium sp. SH668]|uniref:lysophospholipid acyltransferase family protein n=1 Tax=Planctomicrobium sp. SH668 TaxID=3448126 RepID=UPI003F5AEF28
MNPQPNITPPYSWPSRLSPRFVQLYTPWRLAELRQQQIKSINIQYAENVAGALQAGCGVLVVSNHSYHYDSFVLIESGRSAGWLPQIMTSWQVFMMYQPIGRWVLQKHGCFSILREGADPIALRQSTSILQSGNHPLLIYPEGDIYHSNDRVMPFRSGAAAIALMAARKKKRPIVIVPCATKCFYTTDPTRELCDVMSRLEERIHWRPTPESPLLDRIYRFGSGFLALKEVEYLGAPRSGTVRDRIQFLANSILRMIRTRNGFHLEEGSVFDYIRTTRALLVRKMNDQTAIEQAAKRGAHSRLSTSLSPDFQQDFDDLFFVTQLTSYHGDYSSASPTVERMAETIDKFEEDFFELPAPTPRGIRSAQVTFGAPIEVSLDSMTTQTLTIRLETEVQNLLNSIQDPSSASTTERHQHTTINL